MKRPLLIGLALLFFSAMLYGLPYAKITGPCVNCHTMHNSQDNQPMATYGAFGKPWKGTGPYGELTRGTCLGCHGMGTTNKIENMGGSNIPQVYHTDPSGDLAGGNFAYITGAKGSGASNAKGHNVIDVGVPDDKLGGAPGFLSSVHYSAPVTSGNLTCAGMHGCHGERNSRFCGGVSGLPSLKGAHHSNVDGKCYPAFGVNQSYRFLRGVWGLENTGIYKWQNKDAGNHNEYFGRTAPMSGSNCFRCHGDDIDGCNVAPENNTISGFCATCHGDFHFSETVGTGSPFIRHPNDIVLPNSGEYSAYKTYSVEAPVARTTVPDVMSNTVTPGSDVVMCLSCHMAHGSNYPDILRWDYTAMIAGGGGSGGCFTCHTQKK